MVFPCGMDLFPFSFLTRRTPGLEHAGMDPLSKRVVFSWIATDIVWAALFVYVQKREREAGR